MALVVLEAADLLSLQFKNWFFDVSCGFQDMVYWSGDEVDHGDESVDVPVSTGPGSGCLEKPI